MKNKIAKIIVIIAIIAVVFAASFYSIKTQREPVSEPVKTTDDTITENSSVPDSAEESTSETTTEPTTVYEPDPIEMLVNYENSIPDDWEPDLVNLQNGHKVDRHAYDDLLQMLDDARALGYNPLICSSYRTNEKQTTLFNNKVEQYKRNGYSDEEAVAEAAKWVAYPGTSEHQTGLALDIVTVENQVLDESQLNSECQLWMMEHCYEYGFILRYPEDKKDLTKIDFEPWHYRYVGKKAAAKIKEMGICLEEYHALSSN